jgi:hypothetical protein
MSAIMHGQIAGVRCTVGGFLVDEGMKEVAQICRFSCSLVDVGDKE